eukprot:2389683-Rhodomonas_salina.1
MSLCEERGITYPRSLSKTQLVDRLMGEQVLKQVSQLTIPQLQSLCEERDTAYTTRTSRTQLVERLTEHGISYSGEQAIRGGR